MRGQYPRQSAFLRVIRVQRFDRMTCHVAALANNGTAD